MRVIAGKARSLRLKTIDGMDTRPTTDRIKETLFNMLQPCLPDCRFLDLFAGSGAIGIEALSRGAASCVFVENSRKAAECIRENLRFTHLEDGARVMTEDVWTAIRQLDGEQPFDCIFMDPPYRKELELEALKALENTTLVDDHTLLVVEASLDTTWEKAEALGYRVEKIKKYKTNQHVFLRREEGCV